MKLGKIILSLSLLVPMIPTTASNAAVNQSTTSGTITYNLSSGTSVTDSVYFDDFKSHILVPGNKVIFKGTDIDKLALYTNYFEKLNIPISLDDDEFLEANPNSTIKPLNEEEAVTTPTNTTLIAVYNINGRITALQKDELQTEVHDVLKPTLGIQSFQEEESDQQLIDNFVSNMNNEFNTGQKLYGNSGFTSAAVQQPSDADILTSFTKVLAASGTYQKINGAFQGYPAGKAEVTYLIYGGSNKEFFFVREASKIFTADSLDSSGVNWTTGFKSNIRTNSTSNRLIEASPDTQGLDFESKGQYEVGVTLQPGQVPSFSFSYSWPAAPKIKMDATASISTGLATQYIYRNDGISLSQKPFTNGHGALIRATDRKLSFAASTQFRNENAFANGSKWFASNTTNLSYYRS